MKKRLDVLLVEKGLASSREKAKAVIMSGIVYVDGVAMDEPYIADLTQNRIDFDGAQVVPSGCVFVMGDNRNNSSDSRDSRIGMVDKRLIIGKVLLRAFPFSSFGSVY